MTDTYITEAATAVGLATIASDGTVLDSWFPVIQLGTDPAYDGTRHLSRDEAARLLGPASVEALGDDPRRAVSVVAVQTAIEDLSKPPVDVHDIYLRLHLLSNRLIRPHQANLTGTLELRRTAWTSIGPCLPEQLEKLLWIGRARGSLVEIRGIFKLPRMVDYVIPRNVAIADVNRVLLGAHLAAGTFVAPEGFCNFNAGTLGRCMVEGRISAGVVVGEESDIGGGASIMGSLSGGGKQSIKIGKGCLLGANSGVGISLGDNCVVEAGCYVTFGTRVLLPTGEVVKAHQLSGQPDLLFRRNSQSGTVEVLRSPKWGGLHPSLHIVT